MRLGNKLWHNHTAFNPAGISKSWVCHHIELESSHAMHSLANPLPQVAVKESAAFIAGTKREEQAPVLKRPELLHSSQGRVFKDSMREGFRGLHDQLVSISFTG